MKRFGLDVNKTGSYYGGYDWQRGNCYEVLAPSGNQYQLMSGYSGRGDLLGYQITISESELDFMEFRSFNEALEAINMLEKSAKWNLVKIVTEAFKLYENLQGSESGGVGPQRIFLGTVRIPESGEVAVKWKYQAACGLSDRTYHASDDEMHLDYYDISDGVLVETHIEPLIVSEPKPIWADEPWSNESKMAIRELFKKHGLKNTV